ncbi:uncharacterized protein LOC112903036 isoform X2 [Panicum hallii]|uniref:uncharacterized protein LOC112903036 isoform X2 n=1 Tax=Panicum hallii TaxID=206008 RepID=UPI000DF4CCFF|nr:uncharacterized protein LOC112903036 isoform X2 [Panicum hallii]
MDIESRKGSKGDSMAAAASEVSVDWRGRPCDHRKHGGMKAAVFVLGIQAFEMMAIAAVGNNLITYVFGEMHFPLSQAANIVTNFIGTVFLLSLLGGFLSDSYLGSFWTMLIFGFVELSGFILLAVQAHLPQLRPPPCDMMAAAAACEEAGGVKAGIFFAALYLVAVGSGCLKPNIIAHGADQFRRGGGGDARRLSTYFNAAYFSFCVGELVALTVLVWVQTRSGMDVGFGVSAAAMAIGLVSLVAGVAFYRNKPPQGSIFTPIAKVLGQGMREGAGRPRRRGVVGGEGEPVAPVHAGGGGAGEGAAVRGPHLRVHHRLQHHPGAAADLLRAAGQRHGHPPRRLLPRPAGLAAGDPLPHARRAGPGLRGRLRARHAPPHGRRHGDHAAPAHRRGSLRRHLLHGRSRARRGPAPPRRGRRRPAPVHFLDRAAVPRVRALRDVHRRGAHRVLLQAVARRHAGLPHLHDLLLLLLRLLPQLRARVARQQGHQHRRRRRRRRLACQQRPQQGQARPLLLAPRRAQHPQLLQLPLLGEVVLQERRDGAGRRSSERR